MTILPVTVGWFLILEFMNYKEQMQVWLKSHPNATLEEAYEAGYMTCTNNWCHGKVALFEKCREMLKLIIE